MSKTYIIKSYQHTEAKTIAGPFSEEEAAEWMRTHPCQHGGGHGIVKSDEHSYHDLIWEAVRQAG